MQVAWDEAAMQVVIEQEAYRAAMSARGLACLVDPAYEVEDLLQELRLHSWELHRKFDWGRYAVKEEAMKAFRMYVRLGFARRLGRLLQTKVRCSLPLIENAFVEETDE